MDANRDSIRAEPGRADPRSGDSKRKAGNERSFDIALYKLCTASAVVHLASTFVVLTSVGQNAKGLFHFPFGEDIFQILLRPIVSQQDAIFARDVNMRRRDIEHIRVHPEVRGLKGSDRDR